MAMVGGSKMETSDCKLELVRNQNFPVQWEIPFQNFPSESEQVKILKFLVE